METLRELVTAAEENNTLRFTVYTEQAKREVHAHDEKAAMLTAFRHAANSIGSEAGIIGSHVPHDEAADSVVGDYLFIEMITEAELRLKSLSAKYERLRSSALNLEAGCSDHIDSLKDESGYDTLEVSDIRKLINEVREACKDGH